MTQLVEAVKASLAAGVKPLSGSVADCRRQGITMTPETIALFLHLARIAVQDGDRWRLSGGNKQMRLLRAIEKAFTGGLYVPVDKLRSYLDDDMLFTKDDLDQISEAQPTYQIQGDYIIRKKK